MKELFSVFIPTYNRAEVLDKVLVSAIAAFAPYNIDIIISDNASSDNTENIVINHQKKYEYLFYHRNKENIGIDRNMLKALEYTHSKYVFLLGDDDFVDKEFIPSITSFIDKDYDFIVLSSNVKCTKNIEFHDPNLSFDYLWDKMSFGTLIINRVKVGNIDFGKYVGTSHAYAAIPWETMISKNANSLSLFFCEKKIMTLGFGVKTWQSNAADIYLYQIPLWFSLLPNEYLHKDRISKDKLSYLLKTRHLIGLKRRYDLKSLTSYKFMPLYKKILYKILCHLPRFPY